MGLGQQPVEIGERAEQRVHVAMVGDVVAEVGHRRFEERRDPDRVDAEGGDIVQAFDDAGQVAHAIAVGIQETARVDLIDDGTAPPWRLRHWGPPSGFHGTREGARNEPDKLSWAPPAVGLHAYVFTPDGGASPMPDTPSCRSIPATRPGARVEVAVIVSPVPMPVAPLPARQRRLRGRNTTAPPIIPPKPESQTA